MSSENQRDEKKNFDDAVDEQLARNEEGNSADKPPEKGDESADQPALEEQEDEGNPAKTDNE